MTYHTRRLLGLALAELMGVGALAFLLYYVQASGAVSTQDVWATNRVAVYGLLVVTALLLFAPVCAALRLGPIWVVGTGSWALLGYVLLFVPPPVGRQGEAIFTYAAFLALLFLALWSLFAAPLGALGWRLFRPSSPVWARAAREGALGALFVVALFAMSPLGALNWLNVFLVFTIVALTEFFFLARV